MTLAPVPPSGEQFEITGGGYRAVVTESGGALRLLEHFGRPLVDGFDEDEIAYGGRGQLLMPWPNRIQDGRFSWLGQERQLALTEPSRHNASHGLVRWAPWTVEEHTAHSVALTHRVMAQTGYAWTVDMHVTYDLSADGLTVTQTATNLAPEPAPYACGAHPYLTVGTGPVDGWELTVPASRRALVDDRMLPTEIVEVEGTDYDFRVARPIKDTRFDSAYTGLERDSSGRASVTIAGEGRGVVLWGGPEIAWFMVFSADDTGPTTARRSLAVEPMTAPANAFRSQQDLIRLSPAGEDGDQVSVSWGIRSLN